MSYHESYSWGTEIKQGIESILSDSFEVQYFYMDTKNNLSGGPERAREAYELFLEMNPSGVIAADDNAQSMFVVPYLKNKVETPVIFCGVNAEPEQYGYPATNVTGVVERYHIKESFALIQQLVPSAKSVGFIMRGNSPSTTAVFKRLKHDVHTYPFDVMGFREPTTLEAAILMTNEFAQICDLLFLEHFAGLKDRNGKNYSNETVVKMLMKEIGSTPTFCSNASTVKSGVLCTVVESGVEQGAEASKLLTQALNGTPLSEMPIIRNLKGIQMINVTTLKKLDIRPEPALLRGVKLVKTQ